MVFVMADSVAVEEKLHDTKKSTTFPRQLKRCLDLYDVVEDSTRREVSVTPAELKNHHRTGA